MFFSFSNFLNPDEFQNLELELNAFGREYISEHYAACATRIGRTIEFVVYCLSNAWNVTTNKQSIELVEKAQGALDQVRSSYTRLANTPPDERKEIEFKAKRDIITLSERISDLSFNIRDNLNISEVDFPPEPSAILKSVEREYGKGSSTHNDTIRKNVKELTDSDNSPFRIISNYRNRAAHADWTGKYRETTKSEVDEMIEHVKYVIFRLVTIGEAIDQLQRTQQ